MEKKLIKEYREYVRRIIEGDDSTPLEEMPDFEEWKRRKEVLQ